MSRNILYLNKIKSQHLKPGGRKYYEIPFTLSEDSQFDLKAFPDTTHRKLRDRMNFVLRPRGYFICTIDYVNGIALVADL
jgi:REP element-mobilizing transposase RayT